MTRTLTALALVLTLATTGAALLAQAPVPEIAFDANADFLRTPPDTFVGEVGGVGANSKGQLFVYTRTGHPYATLGDNRTFYRGGSRLFQFDPNGKFVRELGQDVYGFNAAIGLRVDPQDNVWTIDAGRQPGREVRRRGSGGAGARPQARDDAGAPRRASGRSARRRRAGRWRSRWAGLGRLAAAARRSGEGTPGSTFFRPTDVAWDGAGNIYIADGLGANNRIAKFDKEGRFIRQWGATGSQPGEFRGVKALAIDAKGNVYAADAGNRRIQIFDADGAFLNQFGNVGTPLAMCITKGATQHLFVSHAGDADGMEDAAIFKVALDGTVVGRFGSAGKLPKQFGLANSLDCRSETELLVGEMTNWRVQRVTLKASR